MIRYMPQNLIKPAEPSSNAGFFFLLARIVKASVEQYNIDKFRNPFLGRGVVGNESKS